MNASNKPISPALAHICVVFTGAMQQKSRDELREQAEAFGAKVKGVVDKEVNIVVAGPGAGAKLQMAREKRVMVFSEDQWLRMIANLKYPAEMRNVHAAVVGSLTDEEFETLIALRDGSASVVLRLEEMSAAPTKHQEDMPKHGVIYYAPDGEWHWSATPISHPDCTDVVSATSWEKTFFNMFGNSTENLRFLNNHRELSERESFMIEAAMQHEFQPLNDDGTIFLASQESIVSLMQAYRTPDQQTYEVFDVNKFIAEKVEELESYAANHEERAYVLTREQAAEMAREVALRIIFDKATLLNNIAKHCHSAAVMAGWWNDLKTGEDLHGKRNIGELIMLMVTELSEAFEATRKNLNDDHLPHRKGVEVEMADAIIRIMDFAGSMKLDIGGALVEKMRFNAIRPDHKPQNRKQQNGKAF